MHTLARPFSPRETMTGYLNADLPLWVRIGCLGWSRANQHGHATFEPGEIGTLLDVAPNRVTDALALAREREWVDDASTSACIVMPGCGLNPCDGRHREADAS